MIHIVDTTGWGCARLVVFDDLCDEVAGVGHVCHDGHTHTQDKGIGVLLQQTLHQSLQI